MPRLSDPAAIRAILESDRAWSVYALGDLAPGFLEHCQWFHSAGPAPALLLLYCAFETPVLFTLGAPARLRPLFGEIGDVRALFLHIRSDVMPLVRERYQVRNETPMWRMLLDHRQHRALLAPDVVRLGADDVPALQRLYADGESAGEAPDFFYPSMVAPGVFFGIRAGKDLVAAGGTHLVSAVESVAAVGNIYTRRDQRRRGLASQVTGAVTTALVRMGIRTVALNVAQRNATAIRVYERLGFVRYCVFNEGIASREPGDSA